jgi:tRNA-2-methylthio-N6-dimethylallyladenosine synthase
MTSHPKDLTDELIETIAQTPSVQRHFHLPAQSGNDRILKAMNRRYTREQYLDRVRALRRYVPDIGLTTDLIVGFPGETEAEFMDTMDLVEEVGYDSAFTFIYSPRVGTPAASLPDQIPPEVSTERIERLIKAQDRHTEKCLHSLIGPVQDVLVTETSRRDETMMTGKCGRNISVNFTGTKEDLGRILPIRVVSAGRTTLRGEKILEETSLLWNYNNHF